MNFPLKSIFEVNPIEWTQKWYNSQCNDDWEHFYGVKIDTLDNPGWSVDVDLVETELEDKNFAEVWYDNSDNDWLMCRVRDNVFEGRGDPEKLLKILRVFKKWAIHHK